MDTKTGRIYTDEEVKKMTEANRKELSLKIMELTPTDEQLRSRQVGRNAPCPCGSGKKFKACCLER